jgi:hypothetical protein
VRFGRTYKVDLAVQWACMSWIELSGALSTQHYCSAPKFIFDGRIMFLGNGLDVDVRHGIGRGGVVGSDHTSPIG